MKRTFLLALAILVLMIAQADTSKMSISTQIFLDRVNGKIDTESEKTSQRARARAAGLKVSDEVTKYDQFVAKPDTIDGKVYMSAFVRVTDASAVSQLESLGVEIQSRFKNGTLLTALIPIEKIEAVSEIASVNRVNAATMMRPTTHVARQLTNVDDVLTQSADAISAGLPSAFDGSGVLLGVIDTGIDFNHIAFKDASGSSRIKQAYVYNGSSATTYSGSQITSTLTDDKTEDHGTHTSSTAGGSSVKVSGTTVTVTTDHANATYGGMAPGANLYLAGINGLSNTYLTNAVNNIVNYADANNMPVVVSNSWGSQLGPHDGTGDVADVYNDLFGDAHPNRVALFAASNDAGKDATGNGGYHVTGSTSASNPLGAILRSHYYSNTDDGYYYNGIILNAWTRNGTSSNLRCKILVINNSTGAVLASKEVTPTASGASVSGLTTYYSGTLVAYKDYIESENKTQVMLYTSGLTTRSSSNYVSNYTLAVQVYPSSGSAITIDMWGGSRCYFTNTPSSSGYTWTNGTDDGCYSDEATIANAISVGAFASLNGGMDTSYTIGDIAGFSSWGTAANSPTGLFYPWITAPGARVIAGVNHNHTSSVDSYSYYGSTLNGDLVVNNSSNPYAYMEGTSMATPAAAGIVALWLQAANTEDGKAKYPSGPTVNDIKEIMKETAIHDSYTDGGANASHFGNGKIDALAGIEYILECNKKPKITASETEIAFSGYTGQTYTKTVTVTGTNLTGNVTATLTDASGAYSISPATISASAAANGATLTITYKPTTPGSTTATVTLSSAGAQDVTISINGTAEGPTVAVNKTSVTFSGYIGETYTQTVTVTGTHLEEDITATLTDASGAYSISPATINSGAAATGATLTITYSPVNGGNTTATVKLTTKNADVVIINISGAAQGPSISASPQALSFNGFINETITKTVTVTGSHLVGDITATLSDADGVFSVSPTTITAAQAASGVTLTVTYSPTAVGTSSGTVTLSTSQSENVTISLTGEAQAPSINVSEQTVNLSGFVGQTYTKTVTVSGVRLTESINVTLDDPDGVFSVSPTTISAADAANGKTLTITYLPVSEGTSTATITLTSAGVDDVVINVSGDAVVAIPVLNVDRSSLTFKSLFDQSVSKVLKVTGENIVKDVTIQLTDEEDMFSVSPSVIKAESLADGKEVTVIVTFLSGADGVFYGSADFETTGLNPVTVTLTGSKWEGGTAADKYFNVANYSTLDAAGWPTSRVDNLYVYSENEADEVGWLTFSSYGLYAASKYGATTSVSSNMGWLEVSGTYYINGGSGAAYTWTASDIFPGSSAYYTSTNSYGFGRSSTTNTTAQTSTYYVTNCSAVKAYGRNVTGAGTSYPRFINVYECTENADGSVNASSTAAKSATSESESFDVMSVVGLDAEKIYKVEVGGARGFFVEVGFQTPLNRLDVRLADLVSARKDVTVGRKYKVVADDLTGIMLSDDAKTLYCKDGGAYANPVTAEPGQIDYVKTLAGLMDKDYDQSNWVALQLPESSEDEFSYQLLGKKLTGVRGELTNKVNPVIKVDASQMPESDGDDEEDYGHNMNVYVTCNFLGTSQTSSVSGKEYFFMPPKPMEVAEVNWAMWDAESKMFVAPSSVGSVNVDQLDGGFYVDFSKMDGTVDLEDGGVYCFTALIGKETVTKSVLSSKKRATASSSYVVYPLDRASFTKIGKIEGDVVTDINEIAADGSKEIRDVRYYDLSGREVRSEARGVVIEVTTYTDGTRKAVKKVK